MLRLRSGRLETPVGIDDSVDIEVGVMVLAASEIAAVGPEPAAPAVGLAQSLVDPVPDMTAQQFVMAADHPPIVAQSAYGVAHRVRILAHQHRPPDKRIAGQPLQFVHRRVHPADDLHRVAVVGIGQVGVFPLGGILFGRFPLSDAAQRNVAPALGIPLRTLVMDDARGIELLRPRRRGRMVRPPARLVAHRPHDHAGVVAVADDHARHALHKGNDPFGTVAQTAAGMVRLDIGFVD